jgi:hypothetical protein
MAEYRRPNVYIPPYDYCDRRCERCAIDKDRCLLWQTETDERLHREIDGKGEPDPDEQIRLMVEDVRSAVRMVEEQAKELGIDLAREVPAGPPPRRREVLDPLAGEGVAVAKAVAAFLRAHGRDFPDEAELLRWHHTMVGPKLGRAAGTDEVDEAEEADAILQAQVAHRMLAEMGAAFEAIRRRRPELGDGMIEVLALMKRMRLEIEERWLSKPNGLLESAADGRWWGPLRDVSGTLKSFRRGPAGR